MKNIIVGTAGHIDHGKTALVKALTGIDADRLEEEKRRGITIDLGFAHLALTPGLTLGFVDVPGHERFVKNMLAGVGGIDLVVADIVELVRLEVEELVAGSFLEGAAVVPVSSTTGAGLDDLRRELARA